MVPTFPNFYKPILTKKQTEKAIKFVKDTFEKELSGELKLNRVTSPLFVPRGSGLNDDLTGVERPVRFQVGNLNNAEMEIVHSLAKWKRMALADHGFSSNTGLYTDMNAIRADDEIDATHSLYVDQWDWELVMDENQRNIDYLKHIVKKIYEALKRTQFFVNENFPSQFPSLPEKIFFIHSEDAQKQYPNLTPEQREFQLAKKHKAIFVIGIGNKLADNKPHGDRAPDYDDWSTDTYDGYKGLNGDLIVWDHIREDALELSSMGIRVDKATLLRQLKEGNALERADLYWHKRLLNNEFPQTIGGGIGQSRLCMFLLNKAHIGEVQASIWDEDTLKTAKDKNIPLM